MPQISAIVSNPSFVNAVIANKTTPQQIVSADEARSRLPVRLF